MVFEVKYVVIRILGPLQAIDYFSLFALFIIIFLLSLIISSLITMSLGMNFEFPEFFEYANLNILTIWGSF